MTLPHFVGKIGDGGEDVCFASHLIGEGVAVNLAFSFFLPCRRLNEAVRVRPPIYTLVYRGSPSPTHRRAAGVCRVFLSLIIQSAGGVR